jgi:hypothetical protein
MIGNVSFSVIITTYQDRYEAAESAAQGWLRQPVDQLWILDGSGKFKPKDPTIEANSRVSIFRMPFDLGPKMDMAMALLTEGDMICLADDDLQPEGNFLAELYRGWLKAGGGIAGIIGRTFEGPEYKGGTTFYAARDISEPVRVGFVGVAFLTTRDVFGFDVRGLPRNADDLWMQMKALPEIPKWVVPTKAYMNHRAASDGTAMYRKPELKAQRAAFYREQYLENYAPKGRKF